MGSSRFRSAASSTSTLQVARYSEHLKYLQGLGTFLFFFHKTLCRTFWSKTRSLTPCSFDWLDWRYHLGRERSLHCLKTPAFIGRVWAGPAWLFRLDPLPPFKRWDFCSSCSVNLHRRRQKQIYPCRLGTSIRKTYRTTASWCCRIRPPSSSCQIKSAFTAIYPAA